MSDDLAMKALAGSVTERAAAVIAAGSDVVLACNGGLEETEAVAAVVPSLAGRALLRVRARPCRIRATAAIRCRRGRSLFRRGAAPRRLNQCNLRCNNSQVFHRRPLVLRMCARGLARLSRALSTPARAVGSRTRLAYLIEAN